ARTTRGRELQLAGTIDALKMALDFYSERSAVADAKAAEFGSHAALAGAVSLGIRIAGRHIEIAPYLGQILFLDTQQIDTLPAGQLHHGHVVFLRHVGNTPQLRRIGHAARNLRYHRKRSV